MSYFGNRQNPLTNVTTDELEIAFKAISDHFGQTWLCDPKGKHKLQVLWPKRDALATVELFTFGLSLHNLASIDRQWLDHHVKQIKGRDENNQNGSIFEILGVNYLRAKDQIVIPAKRDQKGYDVDVVSGESTRWRISLKSYTESVHEKNFRKRMDGIREKSIMLLRSRSLNAQIYVAASKWPSENEWQRLSALLQQELMAFSGKDRIVKVLEGWTLAVLPLVTDNGERLSPGHVSYTFIGVVPFHSNEQQNFISKLNEATANLAKHVSPSAGHFPFIFLRLPPTASAAALKEWTDIYLSENPSSVLDGVIFFQPYLSTQNANKESNISYHAIFANSKRYAATKKSQMCFEIPVGFITHIPPTWQLQAEQKTILLGKEYVYQRGDYYIMMKQTNTGYEGNITKKAPGIHTHAVFQDSSGGLTLSGRFGEELTILGG